MNNMGMEKKEKVLIIDDEEDILQQFKWNLKKDYEVILASSGEAGLESFKSRNPAVVILDLNLTSNGIFDEGF